MESHGISPQLIQRVLDRRGSLAVFDQIDPRRSALVVIDMQNGFIADGYAGSLSSALDMCGRINDLAAALRAAGGIVAWIRHTTDTALGTPWPRYYDFSRAGWGDEMAQVLSPGHIGHEIHPALTVLPEDEQILKTRFSAFIQGASRLDEALSAKGIDTVIITGAVSNICCETTARDAMMLNYKVFFIADANAARSEAEHSATLGNMMLWFADVRDSVSMIDMIKAA